MREKILIIDFDSNYRTSLQKLLEKEGYQVITAKDGLEGSSLYRVEEPDLVIIEPFLPKIHGFDLIREISQGFEKQLSLFIITNFYSEVVCYKEVLKYFQNSAFISKPCKNEQIKSIVSGLLNRNLDTQAKEGQKKKLFPGKDEGMKQEERAPVTGKEGKMKGKDDEIDRLLNEILDKKEEKFSSSRFKGETSKEIEEILRNKLAEFSRSDKKQEASVKEKKKEDDHLEVQKKHEETTQKVQEEKERKGEDSVSTKTDQKQEEQKDPTQQEDTSSRKKTVFPEEIQAVEDKKEISLFKETYFKASKDKKIPRWIMVASGLTAVGLLIFFLILVIPGNSQKKPEISQNLYSHRSEPEEKIGSKLEETSSAIVPEKTSTELLDEPQEFMDDVEEKAQVTAKKQEVFSSKPSPSEERSQVLAKVPEKPSEERQESRSESMTILPPPKLKQFSLPETEEIQGRILPESLLRKDVQKEESLEDTTRPELIPEEKVKAGDIVPLELVDSPPELIKRVEPKYTRAAKNFRVAGRVVLMILISENGDVIQAKIIRGIKNSYGLNEESEKAVRQWKYKPAVKDGVSVKVWKPVAIGFTGK